MAIRIERITFDAVSFSSSDVEAVPRTTDPVSVIRGGGSPSIIGTPSGNDFTIQPGFYLVRIRGADFTSSSNNLVMQFKIRDSSDDSEIEHSPYSSPRRTNEEISFSFSLHLETATSLNLFLSRSHVVSINSGWYLELAKLDSEGTPGPQGPQGDPGPQGPQGEKGDPGTTLTTPAPIREVSAVSNTLGRKLAGIEKRVAGRLGNLREVIYFKQDKTYATGGESTEQTTLQVEMRGSASIGDSVDPETNFILTVFDDILIEPGGWFTWEGSPRRHIVKDVKGEVASTDGRRVVATVEVT